MKTDRRRRGQASFHPLRPRARARRVVFVRVLTGPKSMPLRVAA